MVDVLASLRAAHPRLAELAVKAARAAFDDGPWRSLNGPGRRDLMLKLADLIEQNADEIAHVESLDNGECIVSFKARGPRCPRACFLQLDAAAIQPQRAAASRLLCLCRCRCRSNAC